MGVVAAIIPYNFPPTLMSTTLGPALAAGNAAIVKPAVAMPLSTLRIVELINEPGLPLPRLIGRACALDLTVSGRGLSRRGAFKCLFHGDDTWKGLSAYLEKRTPRYNRTT